MPGLMATRAEYGPSQPLKGARIAGSLHMTIQTAVLIETLQALGADVRWASCNIYSTQDHAAAAIAAAGTPVFAIKGESLEDYWDYTHKIFEWARRRHAEHDPRRRRRRHPADPSRHARRSGRHGLPRPREQRGGGSPLRLDQEAPEGQPGLVRPNGADIKGVTEETTTGVHRLYDHGRRRASFSSRPSTSTTRVTKSKFDNLYGCRESLVDGIRRGTDVMMAGKVAMVAGFGDVGKGSAASLRNAGCRVHGLGNRSDLRPAGRDGRLRGHDDGGRGAPRRHLRHRDRQRRRHHARPHARDEAPRHRLQHRPLRLRDPDRRAARTSSWHNVKPQVDEVEFPDGKRIIVLSEGRLVNLGNATGHPSFVMSASFTNQTLAQIELWTKPGQVREEGLHAAQAPRREGRRACTSTRSA